MNRRKMKDLERTDYSSYCYSFYLFKDDRNAGNQR
jgi:hypothetical protein